MGAGSPAKGPVRAVDNFEGKTSFLRTTWSLSCKQAFAGATSVPDRDYVEFLLKRLAKDGPGNLPSLDVAAQAFKTLGSRPE